MYILYIHVPIYNPIQSYTQCTNIKYRILWSIRLQEVINKVLSCLILWVGATWCYGLFKVLSLRAVCQSSCLMSKGRYSNFLHQTNCFAIFTNSEPTRSILSFRLASFAGLAD